MIRSAHLGVVAITVGVAQSAGDFGRLSDLFATYERDLPAELRHGTVPEVAALAAEYGGENAAFVAMLGPEPVGCVGIKTLDADRAVILRLFVKPQSRGLGAARGLMIAAIEFARSHGRKRIVLDTHKEQLPAAYRLYRSLGFTECTPYGSVSYACPTFMELRLEQ
ncbi:MAG: GNAT family N-acetyltransferase [Candidatus Eremiobacteraeota bacterium]|nr:GNAT family N-acetyltransferase [Candidatus Eremiobacteraeota bacterium]